MIILGKNIQTSPQRLRATLLFETRSRKHKHNVDIYNINYETKSKLLQESKSLEKYSFFIHQVREEKRDEVPLEKAI